MLRMKNDWVQDCSMVWEYSDGRGSANSSSTFPEESLHRVVESVKAVVPSREVHISSASIQLNGISYHNPTQRYYLTFYFSHRNRPLLGL